MERNLDVVSLVGDMDGGVTMNVKKKARDRRHSAKASAGTLPDKGHVREEVSVEISNNQNRVPSRKTGEGLMQLSPPYVAFGQRLLKTSSTRGSLRACIEMLIANEDIRGGFTLQSLYLLRGQVVPSFNVHLAMEVPQIDKQEDTRDLVKTWGRQCKPAVHVKREVL
eukprot:s6001_g5.t1